MPGLPPAVFGQCAGHARWPVPYLLGLIIHVLPSGIGSVLILLVVPVDELSPEGCGQVCLTKALQLVWLVKATWMFLLKITTASPCWTGPSSHIR